MTVTLLAYAPDERWAYVRDGERIVLVRPPFHQDLAASDAEVERAVTIHGFIALDRSFAGRRELLDFLSEESVRVWNERAPSKDLPSLHDELLAALTIADIDRHIERARKKIDAGKLDEAQTLYSRLLAAKELTRSQLHRIASLSEEVRSQREARKKLKDASHRAQLSPKFQRVQANGASRLDLGALRPAA